MAESPRVSGVIIAGGASRRLGRNKALQRVGGRTVIERVIDGLVPLTSELLVVVARLEQAEPLPLPSRVRVTTDRYPGRGALVGIFTGLEASAEPWSLVVASDMPFLNPDLLRYLIGQITDVDSVVPRLKGQPEPLHALYSKACLTPIRQRLEDGDLKVASLFETVRARYVDEAAIDRIDPRHLSFFNVNTRADLEKAQRLAPEVDRSGATLDSGAPGADNPP
jgi:molybdopterin-guanine dinucleotide biosynthesis protein A